MKLKTVAMAFCAATLGLSAVSGNAARFGDENALSWLPMTAKQHESVAKQFKGGSFCLSAERYGDENSLVWLMKATPCKDSDAMVRVPAGWKQSAGAMVRIGDENDLAWLPMAGKQKTMIQKMTTSKKGMCMTTARIGDENDLSWLVRMTDC